MRASCLTSFPSSLTWLGSFCIQRKFCVFDVASFFLTLDCERHTSVSSVFSSGNKKNEPRLFFSVSFLPFLLFFILFYFLLLFEGGQSEDDKGLILSQQLLAATDSQISLAQAYCVLSRPCPVWLSRLLESAKRLYPRWVGRGVGAPALVTQGETVPYPSGPLRPPSRL